ncbi:MAG: NADH-quinone oxidoreductase subunit NuoE [Armatimonadetes bacterium]|nr:NADH-quinone oxidoreductase subunit NuoE [Armatimonadota bacterium]
MLSEKAFAAIEAAKKRYPDPRSALMPALWIAQEECGGWLPREAMADVARVMSLEPADVQSVASFYSMYYKAPVGKFVLEICHNIACDVLGARRIIDHVRERLGIAPGETTGDGLFTLKTVECLAACGGGPCMQVNSRYYENLTPERVDAILDGLRAHAEAGAPPPLPDERPQPADDGDAA